MADLPGSTDVTGAYNNGSSAINNFDPTQTSNTIRGSFDTLKSNQLGTGGPQTAQDYFNNYTSAIAKNPSVTSLYSTANDIFGVPQLASRANTLNTLVTNETPRAYDLMRGFDASDSQVQNKIATDLRFLSPQATAATNEAQTAQNLAGQYVGAGIQQNQMNLLPIQSYGQTLNDTFARQATGYNTAAESLYNGLVAKMQSGVQLSQTEMQQLAALQESKNSYDAAIGSAKISASNQILPTAGGAATYYNPYTGQAYNPFVKLPGQ